MAAQISGVTVQFLLLLAGQISNVTVQFLFLLVESVTAPLEQLQIICSANLAHSV